MKLKRFTALIISLISLFPLYKLVQACAGDYDPYDEYPSFFTNATSNKPAYSPFYYHAWLKYYDEWYDARSIDQTSENTKEWQAYFKQSTAPGDIDSFVYKFSYADLSALYYHLEKNEPLKIAEKVKANAVTKWFQTSKDLEALGYLMYAKQCEEHAANNDEWDAGKKDTARMARLIKNGLQLQKVAKTDFIRDRYSFQVIRMAYYLKDYRRTLELFNALIGERNDQTYIYARCLELKAGALFRQKRKVEAAYLYSRVFSMSDNLKKSAYVSFDWCVGNNINPVLAICKSPQEKAVVHIMDGLHNTEDGIGAMQQAYTLDPQVRGLDVLMTREIQKIEEGYQTKILEQKRNIEAGLWGYKHYPNSNQVEPAEMEKQRKMALRIGRLNEFATKMYSVKAKDNPAYWQLASSYLYFMDGKLEEAKKMLTTAKGLKTQDGEQYQSNILATLYTIGYNREITPAVEAELLTLLKTVQSGQSEKVFRDIMGNMLTSAYLHQGDTVKAIYTLARGNGSADMSFGDLPGGLLEKISTQKLQDAQAFLQKKNASRFERWLIEKSPYTEVSLSELEATKYIRQYKFDKAVAVLSKTQWTPNLPDPFATYVSDKYELTPTDTKTLYSKLTFAERMHSLQEQIKAKPNDAEALYHYAAGLYSMTYYGKSTYAYTYYRSSSDGFAYFNSDGRKAAPMYEQEYYGAYTAEKMFAKAAANFNNPEQKAKALFMAAKCWQKRCEVTNTKYYYDEEMLEAYYQYSLHNPYFEQLKGTTAATKLYEEAIGTCGYFSDYVNKKR